MTLQSSSEPPTVPVSGSKITDLLPEVQWVGELLYHCIRSHEERVQELQAERSGYDPQAAHRAIETARASLDGFLGMVGLVEMKRDLVLSYWDRGLQRDAIRAVHSGFAEKIRADPEKWNGLVGVFQYFVKDPQYQSEGGLTFYGGASLCMQVAHEAGRDPNDLIREVAASAGIAAGSMK